MIPDEAVEAALAELPIEATRFFNRARARNLLEAAAPHLMATRIEVGYVCRHGHFQFIDDPDGDACGTKRVGTIYIQTDDEVTPEELTEAVEYSLESHHRKMEEWRKQ